MSLGINPFSSPSPSPTLWQGANNYNFQPAIPSYHSPLEPNSEPNKRTNYVDMALNIVKGDKERLKNEHSYTWPGRVLNWVFGWGEYNVKELDTSEEGGKLKEHLQLVLEIYNKSSIEGSRKQSLKRTSETTLQLYSTVIALQKGTENPVYTSEHAFVNCGSYSQTCKITFNSSLEEIGAASNDKKQFPISYLGCIQQRVEGEYYEKVEALPFAQNCLVKPGELINQTIAPVNFEVFPTNNGTYYIFDQENIDFSEKLVEACYENNLIQKSNNQTNFVNLDKEEGLICATGGTTIPFPGFYCEREFNDETYELKLSLFGNSQIGILYENSFFNQYCNCSLNSVDLYFQWVKGNATICSLLDTQNTTLNYPIGNDGMFSIEAPAGLITTQSKIDFPIDKIQQCFNTAYNEYSKKAKTTDWVLVIIASVGITGIVAVGALFTYKTKWPQKLYVRCLNKPQPSIQNYEEIGSNTSV
jgi:hypothetical protein